MKRKYIIPNLRAVELGAEEMLLDLSNNLGIGDGGETKGKEIEVNVKEQNSFGGKSLWDNEW